MFKSKCRHVWTAFDEHRSFILPVVIDRAACAEECRDHATLRMPELRAAALFREHPLRELRAAARLSAGAGDRHGAARRATADWRALADPKGRYRYCANALHEVCNWLIPADSPEQFCVACRHNRTIPDLSLPENLQHWRKIEVAKHRLFYTLLKLRLPLSTRTRSPTALAFDFLADQTGPTAATPVMTGHDERPDHHQPGRSRRFRARAPARSRWASPTARCSVISATRSRTTTGTAWSAQSAEPRGVPRGVRRRAAGLRRRRCSSTMPTDRRRTGRSTSSPPMPASHPWEDFAETWAHYFHMVDTLETAQRLRPARAAEGRQAAPTWPPSVDFDPHSADHGPHHRRLAAADLRGQFDQPQHGASPTSIRSCWRRRSSSSCRSSTARFTRTAGSPVRDTARGALRAVDRRLQTHRRAPGLS